MNLIMSTTTISASFDCLVDQVTTAVTQAGFVICGVADFQKNHEELLNVHHGGYKVISVDLPTTSAQMISPDLERGMVLPACISIVELYPGSVSIVVVNPTEILAAVAGDVRLVSLAKGVTHRLFSVIHQFEKENGNAPELVTSWG